MPFLQVAVFRSNDFLLWTPLETEEPGSYLGVVPPHSSAGKSPDLVGIAFTPAGAGGR